MSRHSRGGGDRNRGHGRPKRAGLGGFFFVSKGMMPNAFYKPGGPATVKDFMLMGEASTVIRSP
jgi:hypothetical protein